MKKKTWLICMMCIMVLITGWWYKLNNERKVWLRAGDDGKLYAQFTLDQHKEQLFSWKDWQGDGLINYFFLPAFVKGHIIWFDTGFIEIWQNGKKIGENGYFEWKSDEVYDIRVLGESQKEVSEQKIIFMKSEKIPAVFIETASGSMEYLHQSKENEEQGYMKIVSAQGNTEYSGKLPRISGRGNRSWWYEKKSYSFSLKSAQPLCGLDRGKKWNLLALTRERTKLSTKLAMDIGSILEMEYTPQGIWVDLYLDGEYAGNYLLTESVSVGEGRVEIYDLEKENERMNPDIESSESFFGKRYEGI